MRRRRRKKVDKDDNEWDVKESNDEEWRKEAHLRDVCWQVAQKGHGRLPGQVW